MSHGCTPYVRASGLVRETGRELTEDDHHQLFVDQAFPDVPFQVASHKGHRAVYLVTLCWEEKGRIRAGQSCEHAYTTYEGATQAMRLLMEKYSRTVECATVTKVTLDEEVEE